MRCFQSCKTGLFRTTPYFGVPTQKIPLAFWVYQEIVSEKKPDVFIEIGIARGGGTSVLARLCDIIGTGRTIGLDVDHSQVVKAVKIHPRITMISGESCASFQ
jgi:cephalosporin hydroxylase